MHTPLALQQLGATTPTRTLAVTVRYGIRLGDLKENVCVLLLQDLLQSCSRGGGRRVEDMFYERRRAEACVDESAHHALGPLRNPVL